MLALMEVIFAIGFYGWMARYSGWPWMVFVGMIAAPLLLLRSPASIELSINMLDQYWNRSNKDISKKEIRLVFAILAIAPLLFSYWLTSFWPPLKLSNWPQFFLIALFVFAFGYAIAEMIKVAINGKSGTAVYITKIPLFIFTVPSYVAGILLRSTLIRWFATLRHLPSGLRRIPNNWHETLFVTDLFHQPELLPGANRVNELFTVKGVWLASWQDIHMRILFSTMIVAWYIPALAYRWSLKASAWLWWPLALALTSPLNGLGEKTVRERTAINVSGSWGWTLLFVPAVALAWLLSSMPSIAAVLKLLPAGVGEIAKLFPAPPQPVSVRFVALALFCIMALVYWWRIRNLKATHGKVLDTPKEFNDLKEEDKSRFMELARPIEKLRVLMIVTVLFFGEACAAVFFHNVNPQEAENLIPIWLQNML